jgi:hypothetical protein
LLPAVEGCAATRAASPANSLYEEATMADVAARPVADDLYYDPYNPTNCPTCRSGYVNPTPELEEVAFVESK